MFWPIGVLELKRGGSTPTKKGRRHNKKCKGKTMLSIEVSGELGAAKKAKADDPGKEVAGCAACLALMAASKPGGSDKQYCKIHRTKGHDLQNCRQVELLAEKQTAEYERRDKEKGQDGAEGSGKKRGGQGGHHGKDNRQERPARGRDKKEEDYDHDEDDESDEHQFQEATNAMCIKVVRESWIRGSSGVQTMVCGSD